ncbi:MAG: LPS assembly protein LptD, partial [Rhodospirillales bacterium]
KVEGGPRISYGLKWGVYGQGGGKSSFFIGQSWRPKSDTKSFAIGSGLEEKFSDIVARAHISPGSHLNLLYRTRFAKDTLSPRRNELAFNASVPYTPITVGANYVFIETQEDSEFSGREEINYSASSTLFNKNWRLSLSGITDLEAGETRTIASTLTYHNECVTVSAVATRAFFSDRDLEPEDKVTLNLTLKNLGEFTTGTISSKSGE